jgi:hypothetical protein
LRATLDGGGDPNGRDEEGVPVILLNWRVSHYADSQSRAGLDLLLDRGADPNRVAPDGMTFAKMLIAHRERFSRENKKPPPDFQPLWDRVQASGIFSPPPAVSSPT